jgi:hypothetical protein
MGMSSSTRCRASTAVVAAGSLLVAAACSSNPARPPSASTTSTAPATTSASATPTTVAIADRVTAATQAYVAATRACLTNPGAPCDLSSVALPPETTVEEQSLRSLAAKHLRARPSPQTKLIDESVTVAPSATEATVRVCDIDADILFTPGAGPNGQDVIYNDTVGADRADWTLKLDNGRWKVAEVRNLQHWNAATCPPAS